MEHIHTIVTKHTREHLWLYGGAILYIGLSIILLNAIPKYAPLIVPALCFVPIAFYLMFSYINVMFLLYIAAIPLVQHFSFYYIELGDFKITPHMASQLFLTLSLIGHSLLKASTVEFTLTKTDKWFLIFVVMSIVPLLIGYTFEVNHVKRWLLFYTGILETVTFYFALRYLLNIKAVTTDHIVLALVGTSFAALIVAFIELRAVGMDLISIYTSRMSIGFGYHNTNLFGIHAALLLPILMYAVVDKQFERYRYVSLLSFCILLFLSLICFNRGTFLVIGLQLLLLMFMKQNRPMIYLLIMGSIAVGILYNDLLLLYFLKFFAGGGKETTLTVMDTSVNYRIDAWLTGLIVLVNYPFGVGAGSFQYMYEIYGSIPNLYLGTPHHLLLSVGVDYGLPALILLLMILITAIQTSIRKYGSNKIDYSVFFYIAVSLIGFGVYGLVTDGELSHLSGSIAPNNGYTLVLFIIIVLTVNERFTGTHRDEPQ